MHLNALFDFLGRTFTTRDGDAAKNADASDQAAAFSAALAAAFGLSAPSATGSEADVLPGEEGDGAPHPVPAEDTASSEEESARSETEAAATGPSKQRAEAGSDADVRSPNPSAATDAAAATADAAPTTAAGATPAAPADASASASSSTSSSAARPTSERVTEVAADTSWRAADTNQAASAAPAAEPAGSDAAASSPSAPVSEHGAAPGVVETLKPIIESDAADAASGETTSTEKRGRNQPPSTSTPTADGPSATPDSSGELTAAERKERVSDVTPGPASPDPRASEGLPASEDAAKPTDTSTARPTARPTAEASAESTAGPTAGPTAEASAGHRAEPTAGPRAEPTAEATQNPAAKSAAKSAANADAPNRPPHVTSPGAVFADAPRSPQPRNETELVEPGFERVDDASKSGMATSRAAETGTTDPGAEVAERPKGDKAAPSRAADLARAAWSSRRSGNDAAARGAETKPLSAAATPPSGHPAPEADPTSGTASTADNTFVSASDLEQPIAGATVMDASESARPSAKPTAAAPGIESTPPRPAISADPVSTDPAAVSPDEGIKATLDAPESHADKSDTAAPLVRTSEQAMSRQEPLRAGSEQKNTSAVAPTSTDSHGTAADGNPDSPSGDDDGQQAAQRVSAIVSDQNDAELAVSEVPFDDLLVDRSSEPEETAFTPDQKVTANRLVASPSTNVAARGHAAPGSLMWLRSMLAQSTRSLAPSQGWKAIEVELDDGLGTMTVRARRDDDGVSVSVSFSDPKVRSLAEANAQRLQDALKAEYESNVDLSLMSDGSSDTPEQRQQPDPGRRTASAGPATAPTVERSIEVARPRPAAAGIRNEWIG